MFTRSDYIYRFKLTNKPVLGAYRLQITPYELQIQFASFGELSVYSYAIILCLSLSTVVLNSRDWQGKLWLPEKTRPKKQPCKNNRLKN